VLKTAFEQIYGAPYLARMLFAEVEATSEADLFLRVEYDGAIATNGGSIAQTKQYFGVVSGTRQSTEMMESYLAKEHQPDVTLVRAMKTALDAWSVGRLAAGEEGAKEIPSRDDIAKHRKEQSESVPIEAALLERNSRLPIRYRTLSEEEIKTLSGD
jgi:proteasome alpha subunit